MTAVPVDGNVDALLKQIDTVVSDDASTVKDVADAAVALAYVQAKGARRCDAKLSMHPVQSSGLENPRLAAAARMLAQPPTAAVRCLPIACAGCGARCLSAPPR